ncbi:hypothetical protein SAMN02949497_4876 [Methylomagnum ishizawai]|uniref:Uncharacterized protein n=1 Tax=Methylomagnum ishizawai TaxID=1760988 RepID=A0A1Y6D5K9_9GAMM|nr:hypothetical protein [Methylomagnum ishizawai]SMF97891.1 hypothetical protein SAMN02949497_4876 [Methylomagnum ishizawai]
MGRLPSPPLDAWHHHMALVMLGTLFLEKQKVAGRQSWPMLSFSDLVTALAHLLPARPLTAEDLATSSPSGIGCGGKPAIPTLGGQ